MTCRDYQLLSLVIDAVLQVLSRCLVLVLFGDTFREFNLCLSVLVIKLMGSYVSDITCG